jgi:hypothetical protein
MPEVDINYFLQLLREHRFFTSKQTKFLQYIIMYLNEGKCYQLLLHAYPCTLKKAQKVGLNGLYTKKEVDLDYIIKTPWGIVPKGKEKLEEYDISKGKHIVQYSLKNRDYQIYKNEG